MPGVSVYYSEWETFTVLNRLVTNVQLRRMLEGKDYLGDDMAFPLVAGFIDRATRCTNEASMTHVHSSQSILVRKPGDLYGAQWI